MAPVIVVADNFLTGALLTLLIPAATLVAVAIWYTRTVLRMSASRHGDPADAPVGTPASTGLHADAEPPAAHT